MAASITSRLLTELLPPDLAASVRQHLLDPRAPFQIYTQALASQLQGLLSSLSPYVQPMVDRALAAMVDNQGATGLVVLLVLMTAVVVVMNWIRRLVMWWTRLVMQGVFWAGVVLALAWVWNRGVLESVRDAVVLASKVLGYLAVLKDFWMEEYERYEANGSGSGSGSGSGFGAARGRSSGR
ncbi:hypothetical protein QQS21_012524 [Conoideocrella luteorostrata]|uniref:Nuclear pore assembly and biogenesis-domain-containing protein n=1 Tax=Conoideocrella luteorostrata TaxID=1105319 RepID=A0AAJ0FSM3_9HYPO|nr:hypothetical protein QQS21_012524 [Conoideocrella luteorostrata]